MKTDGIDTMLLRAIRRTEAEGIKITKNRKRISSEGLAAALTRAIADEPEAHVLHRAAIECETLGDRMEVSLARFG